jgi:hypothetical protein
VAARHSTSEALDQRPAEIERAQLGEGEAGVVEPLERALLEHPVALAVDQLVVEGESRSLQGFEVAPDGSRRHAGAVRKVVNREAAGGLQVAKD